MESLDRNKYFLTFIEDAFRKICVFFEDQGSGIRKFLAILCHGIM